MINSYALFYLFAYVAPGIIGFLALILYTHLLSPAEYGTYVIGASIAGMISGVFFSWIRLAVSRYQARSPELDLRAAAIIAYGGTAVVVACLTPVAVLLVRPSLGFGVVAASLLFSLSLTAFEISQEFRRARLNPVRFTIVNVLRSSLGLVFGYAAVKLGAGGLGLLLGIGASFLLTNLLSLQGNTTGPLRLLSANYLGQFVRYGLPFSVGALASTLHGALDRLSVAYLLGQSGAGYYGFTADMTRQIIGLLAASVGAAMFPIVFRSFADVDTGLATTRARLKEGMELLLALIAPVTVWLAISANVIAQALLGAEFQTSFITLLPLLAVGRMCGSINQFYLHISFQLAEKPMLQVTHDSLTLVLSISLLFPLTMLFGLPGTAAAILIAEASGLLIGTWLSRKAFKLPFNGRGIARVFAATAVMGVTTYAAQAIFREQGLAQLAIAVGSGGLAYVGGAILFDVADIRTMIAAYLGPRWVAAE
jgi:O-antigen/teichoic acid export membrane protein